CSRCGTQKRDRRNHRLWRVRLPEAGQSGQPLGHTYPERIELPVWSFPYSNRDNSANDELIWLMARILTVFRRDVKPLLRRINRDNSHLKTPQLPSSKPVCAGRESAQPNRANSDTRSLNRTLHFRFSEVSD